MKEHEIRPQGLFDDYLALAREDIQTFFSDRSQFEEVSCVACCGDKSELAWEKLGFPYARCLDCESVFVSPRPTEEALGRFYREGASVKHWSTRFYKDTEQPRRAKIYRPRAELIAGIVPRLEIRRPSTFADIGSGYGIFLEEIERTGAFDHVKGIEPAGNMAESCRERGFEIVEKPVEQVRTGDIQASFATCFEVVEHVYSPENFLRSVRNVLEPGGIFLFTTLTISGFDLQVLGEHSKSIHPPHHINFISVEGMRELVERSGYEIVELCTPGKLDVDIVENLHKEKPEVELPRFVRYLLEHRDEKTRQSFQSFLQESNLSSHIRCIARKRATA